MKCDCCGKVFEAGNRADGIPNGLGFQLRDGGMVTLCADCLTDKTKYKPFIDRLTQSKRS